MLLVIENVLTPLQAQEFAATLLAQPWQDGCHTAGTQSAGVKHNQQLAAQHPVAHEIAQNITHILAQHPLFVSAVLPHTIMPPLFNCYRTGDYFGVHVDNAIRGLPNGRDRIRTDVSCTLFLNPPTDYDGGILTIETHYGAQEVKLPAGSLVIYPASSLHHVTPVTRGQRLCAFFWSQSLIACAQMRSMLFDLDQTIQQLTSQLGTNDASVVRLSGIYHNLIRQHAVL